MIGQWAGRRAGAGLRQAWRWSALRSAHCTSGAIAAGSTGGPAIFVQYIAVAILFAAAAWLFEDHAVRWIGEFVLSLVWLVVVLSTGSIGLLYWLIRRSAAT